MGEPSRRAESDPPHSVDVLIVSYNTREILRDCLRSIDQHRPPGIELRVSVFDNASADGSPDMIAEEFPWVRLVRSQENLGFGPANNRLAETSQADYLLLLNPDTIWTEDIVTPLRAALDADPRAIIAAPRLSWPDGRTQPSAGDLPRLSSTLAIILRNAGLRGGREAPAAETTPDDRGHPRAVQMAWGTCWLLRREDVERDGLFDPRYTMYDEDVDYCMRALKRGRIVIYHPGVDLIHIGEASSEPRSRQDRMWVARQRFYRDHYGRAAGAFYRAMILAAKTLRAISERRQA